MAITVLALCVLPYIEVAEVVFNRCTETNTTKDGTTRPDSTGYKVTFNYEFLEDFRDPVTAAQQFTRALTKKWVGSVGPGNESGDWSLGIRLMCGA